MTTREEVDHALSAIRRSNNRECERFDHKRRAMAHGKWEKPRFYYINLGTHWRHNVLPTLPRKAVRRD